MSQTANQPKLCIHCREDCSDRPRLRDQRGRYHCKACVDRLQLAHTPVANHGAANAKDEAPDDGPIPLMEEPDEVASPDALCPGCRKPIHPEAKVCVKCGLDLESGHRVDTLVEASEKLRRASVKAKRVCPECGYDMTGLRAPKCPECGTVSLDPRKNRAAREAMEARRLARRAWITPIIMIMIAVPTMAGIDVARFGVSGLGYYAVTFGIFLALALQVYIICGVLWIGFDQPLPLTALRVTGAFAVADVIFNLVAMATMATLGMFGITILLIPTAIYMGILSKVMDIDFQDAMFVAMITTLTRILALVFLIDWLQSLL